MNSHINVDRTRLTNNFSDHQSTKNKYFEIDCTPTFTANRARLTNKCRRHCTTKTNNLTTKLLELSLPQQVSPELFLFPRGEDKSLLRDESEATNFNSRALKKLHPLSERIHTEKYFRYLVKSNRNLIVFTVHRLIWNKMVHI